MMRMGSALILTPATGSEMTAGTPQADPCQPCLLEIKPSTCIHLPPCMNGYLSLAILHQCHLTTEGQHSGFPASMRHTWSPMEAQEVFVTNTMPQRVLFTGRGLVAIFSANLCSRHALEDESYRGACTRQTSEPVSHQSSGLVVGEPQLKCVELGVPGDWSTHSTTQLQGSNGHNSACSHHLPPCTVKQTMEALFCVHSPLYLCQKS